MASKYCGCDANTISSGGGSVRVTIALNVGQGNAGVSLPCKGCIIITDGTDVRVKIGSACIVSTGIPVPWYAHSTTATQAYSVYNSLFLPVDDVANLYFYGATNGKIIDILYFL